MRKISSSQTFVYKRVFPIFWFGFLAIFSCLAFHETWMEHISVFVLLAPIAMAAFGYFLMRALVFDLVDEVHFDGKEFIVRNGGVEDRFDVASVINVDLSETNPERITLTLSEPRVR
jgi:hypothetical protein